MATVNRGDLQETGSALRDVMAPKARAQYAETFSVPLHNFARRVLNPTSVAYELPMYRHESFDSGRLGSLQNF